MQIFNAREGMVWVGWDLNFLGLFDEHGDASRSLLRKDFGPRCVVSRGSSAVSSFLLLPQLEGLQSISDWGACDRLSNNPPPKFYIFRTCELVT